MKHITSKRIIQPGGTLGVLGSGQLGRMFTIAARRLGYRVHVFSPDYDTPTGQVADLEIRAAYDDLDAVAGFAKAVDVVTFEFENVPAATIEAVKKYVPVRPGGEVLHTTQNRLREKNFLKDAGLPVTPFYAIHSADDLQQALQSASAKTVLKTAAWGYDGKGQMKLDSSSDSTEIWSLMQTDSAVLEEFVDFECELSVVAARGFDGQFVSFDPILNMHTNHILDVSISPATLPAGVARQAQEIARSVMEQLEVVGVLCVEYFLTTTGKLLINELAPRPHNSGHLTMDAHVTCQFEQQVRAVTGLPLGSTEQLRPAAMVNLLGDRWQTGLPNWAAALNNQHVKLHLYGKSEARAGRKMGHLTVLADSVNTAQAMAVAARDRLSECRGENM